MSTYDAIDSRRQHRKAKRNDGSGTVVEIPHSEVVANHYKYRDAVDKHNAKRHDGGTHQGISLERTWQTIWWPNRVFAFMLVPRL